MLTRERKMKRIDYCRLMVDFPSWDKVVFVYESMFCSTKYGPKRIIKPRGERFNDAYANLIDFAGRSSISVFGVLTSRGLGLLIKIDGRLNSVQYCEILRQCLPFLNDKFDRFLWFQDNCPVHDSNYTVQWVQSNSPCLILPHPPYSPDFKSTENIWGLAEQLLSSYPRPRNSNEYFDQILLAWRTIGCNRELIHDLYASMNNRLKLCIGRGGAITRY